MYFCTSCGALIRPGEGDDQCADCLPGGREPLSRSPDGLASGIEALPSTRSGHIKKVDAERWLKALPRPSSTTLKAAMLPKPYGFTGSSHAADISNIRVTGDARFVETFAGLLTPLLDLENDETRVDLKLGRTKERDTRKYTGNYELYVSIAERGR